MAEQKGLDGREKELLDEELGEVAGGVLGIGASQPVVSKGPDGASRPAAAPRTRS